MLGRSVTESGVLSKKIAKVYNAAYNDEAAMILLIACNQEKMHEEIMEHKIKSTILLGIGIVYIFAFSTFYYQFQGLYGSQGIQPLNQRIDNGLLGIAGERLLSHANIDSIYEATSLIGLIIAMLSVAFRPMRNTFSFSIMYACYLISQSPRIMCLSNQWDMLLLESGFLTILLSCRLFDIKPVMFLFRWLTFRFIFSSGSMTLLNRCPLWWSLQGLQNHYQNQCLPTVLSYFVHKLPLIVHKFSEAIFLIISIGFSWPLILPFRRLRNVSFLSIALLQFALFLTTNHSFSNFLVTLIGYSTLSSNFSRKIDVSLYSQFIKITKNLLSYFIIPLGLIVICILHWFGLTIDYANKEIDLSIKFSYYHFFEFVNYAVILSCIIGYIHLLYIFIISFNRSIINSRGSFGTTIAFYRQTYRLAFKNNIIYNIS
ncbi:hypothetical protein GJ496_002725 [Pomphorhynchus laevis]|nr:hypothetical protein GJ496_002725 [Pomphorhynchus laevis]